MAEKSADSTMSEASLKAIASAAATRTSERICPSPVLAITEVMTPAAAQTAMTGSADRIPELSAP